MMPSSSISWSCGTRRECSILYLLVRVIPIYTLTEWLLGSIMISNFHWEFPPIRLTVGAGSECFFASYLIRLFPENLWCCFIIDVLLATLGSRNYSSSPSLVLGVAISSTVRLDYGSNIRKCIWIIELWGNCVGSYLAQVTWIFEVRLVVWNWLLRRRFLDLRRSSRCSRVWYLKVHCIVALAKNILDSTLLQCSITCIDILRTKRFLASHLHCVNI